MGQVEDIQWQLQKIGWPIAVDGDYGPLTHQAVRDFQWGYIHENLSVDGEARWTGATESLTFRAMKESNNHGGVCGEFFKFREFASKGNGWIRVNPKLVKGLDIYRKKYGPVIIESGYRDPAHNAAVGGASGSQHTYGNAADIRNYKVPYAELKALKLFSGMGRAGQSMSAPVIHVDTRSGSVDNPVHWWYDSNGRWHAG